MKYIIKQSEPEKFRIWKRTTSQATYGALKGTEVKRIIKKSLIKEQGYICCYCEKRLTYKDSHIEHFQPQSSPTVDPLDYSNFLCSCQNQREKGTPRHCGHLKEDWFDPILLISPLESGCESRFRFNGDGTIYASNSQDRAAITTIEKLGLSLPILNDVRNKAIEPFLDDNLTDDQFQEFINGYLQQNNQGMLGEFWTTIQQLFGDKK
jgi:uncharacterized protein (TIGR02646 family)